MLRITFTQETGEVKCRLAGKLVGPWAEEFATAWAATSAQLGDRVATVDLQDVTFVDETGERLLAQLHEQGVQLRASRPLTREIVRCCQRSLSGGLQG